MIYFSDCLIYYRLGLGSWLGPGNIFAQHGEPVLMMGVAVVELRDTAIGGPSAPVTSWSFRCGAATIVKLLVLNNWRFGRWSLRPNRGLGSITARCEKRGFGRGSDEYNGMRSMKFETILVHSAAGAECVARSVALVGVLVRGSVVGTRKLEHCRRGFAIDAAPCWLHGILASAYWGGQRNARLPAGVASC